MPPSRRDRTPERTDGIRVELTEFGPWIEVHDQPRGWHGMFLSARALRSLVTLPTQERIAALAALDPAVVAARQRGRRPATTDTSDGQGQPGAA